MGLYAIINLWKLLNGTRGDSTFKGRTTDGYTSCPMKVQGAVGRVGNVSVSVSAEQPWSSPLPTSDRDTRHPAVATRWMSTPNGSPPMAVWGVVSTKRGPRCGNAAVSPARRVIRTMGGAESASATVGSTRFPHSCPTLGTFRTGCLSIGLIPTGITHQKTVGWPPASNRTATSATRDESPWARLPSLFRSGPNETGSSPAQYGYGYVVAGPPLMQFKSQPQWEPTRTSAAEPATLVEVA